MSADGGRPEQLTKPDGAENGYAHVYPQRLPGTKDILFGFWGQTFFNAVFSPDTKQWRGVTPPTKILAGVTIHVPGGYLAANDGGGGIVIAPWTPASDTPRNLETPVLDRVYWALSTERSWLNVSDNGTAVYVPGDPQKRHLVWVDRQGRVTQMPGGAALFSPGHALRRRQADRRGRHGCAVDCRFGRAHGRVWCRSGARITAGGSRAGSPGRELEQGRRLGSLHRRRQRRRADAAAQEAARTASADGRGRRNDHLSGTSAGDGLRPVEAHAGRQDHAAGGDAVQRHVSAISADGRYVAYVSDESGREEVLAIPMSGKGERTFVSINGGSSPVWSRDGKELFYRAGDELMSVTVTTTGALTLGERRKLIDLTGYDSGDFRDFDVSADGQRFLLIYTDPACAPHASTSSSIGSTTFGRRWADPSGPSEPEAFRFSHPRSAIGQEDAQCFSNSRVMLKPPSPLS